MKRTVLKKSVLLLLAALCLALAFSLPAAAADAGRVYDPSGMLTASEAANLASRMEELSAESGVELYFATYVAENRYDDFYGDDYCTRVKNLRGTDAVLLVVTYEERNDTYYYNMYTYGDANYNISQKEVDYILDSRSVYNNLKFGYIYDGAVAFFEDSAKAFTGRVGVSWGIVIAVSAVIAFLIALGVRAGVVAAYKHKKATVDYPLDTYAKLDLTREKDSFVREYTTRSYVPRSNGGSGGSRHGGGGGHRGGR